MERFLKLVFFSGGGIFTLTSSITLANLLYQKGSFSKLIIIKGIFWLKFFTYIPFNYVLSQNNFNCKKETFCHVWRNTVFWHIMWTWKAFDLLEKIVFKGILYVLQIDFKIGWIIPLVEFSLPLNLNHEKNIFNCHIHDKEFKLGLGRRASSAT